MQEILAWWKQDREVWKYLHQIWLPRSICWFYINKPGRHKGRY